MSHEIDMSNDRENMAYVGATPWHKLGTKFEGNEDFDQWRVAAGFDWEALTKILHYKSKHVTGREVDIVVPSHRALVRSDIETVLGIVGKDYKVVQPAAVLEFFREIAFASDSRYTMETAGCLSGGKRVWALAKTKQEMVLGGNDVIKPYLLFGTGFTGKDATFADWTAVRVVCHNTMQMAVGIDAVNAAIRIPHTQSFELGDVHRALGLIDAAGDQIIENFQQTVTTLANRNEVSDQDMFTYFAELYGPKLEEGQKVTDLKIGDFTAGQQRNINDLIALFADGPGSQLETAKRTAWGLVNSVTYFEDFARGKDDQRRLASSAFGAGARRKKQAVEMGLALAA